VHPEPMRRSNQVGPPMPKFGRKSCLLSLCASSGLTDIHHQGQSPGKDWQIQGVRAAKYRGYFGSARFEQYSGSPIVDHNCSETGKDI